jgi:uncharacterized membrane protein YtjA (UPF0391 family)
MPGWAITFVILALIAAYLGFFTLSGIAAIAAKIVLAVFVILLAASVAVSFIGTRRPD